MCNCEFCIKCDCGHKADEHMAGDGLCYKCECPQFHSLVVDCWELLDKETQETTSFEEFANAITGLEGS